MITVTRRLEIDAGHRLMNHEGKCKSVHGHRYAFEVTCSSRGPLDDVGRVIDFGLIKERVGAWLDENWDHAFIFQEGDPVGDMLTATGQKVYKLGCPPTAENLAELVFAVACNLLPLEDIKVVRVRCWETPNCYADYAPFSKEE